MPEVQPIMSQGICATVENAWRRLVQALSGAWNSRLSTGLYPECLCHVRFDGEGLTVMLPDAPPATVRWTDLQEVFIQTTADGPWCPDVFWVLVGAGSGCVFPQRATGEGEAVKRLGELPGFDFEAVIEAMGCCENRRFVCWKREP
jgi:hypothetical protein